MHPESYGAWLAETESAYYPFKSKSALSTLSTGWMPEGKTVVYVVSLYGIVYGFIDIDKVKENIYQKYYNQKPCKYCNNPTLDMFCCTCATSRRTQYLMNRSYTGKDEKPRHVRDTGDSEFTQKVTHQACDTSGSSIGPLLGSTLFFDMKDFTIASVPLD